MGNRSAPHHSMVIVQKTGVNVFVRGFNNAGVFGGPFMDWDFALRDIADNTRWKKNGQFEANNGYCDVFTITYSTVCQNIPDTLNF